MEYVIFPAPPSLEGEAGWSPLPPLPWHGQGSPFISNAEEGTRLRVRFFRRVSDQALVGRVWFGPGTEGAPGVVHGGAVMTLLDHALGAAAWLSGHMSVTGSLTVEFRLPVRLLTVAAFTTSVEQVEAKKIHMRGVLVEEGGQVLAEAQGVFIKVDMSHFAAFAAAPASDS